MSNEAIQEKTETNAEAFQRLRDSLLSGHEGKFALFHAGVLVQTFDSLGAAYDHALEQFGDDPVYIGRISKEPLLQQAPALYHGLIHARI